MKVRTKLIGTVVLGAALVVPVAQAQTPDDRAGARGPGAIAALQTGTAQHPDNRATHGTGSVGVEQTVSVSRPDDRAGVRGPGAFGSWQTPAASTHPDNRSDARGPGSLTPVVVQPTSSGFDWGDALIGGIGGMGTALLLTGCLFLLLSQRDKTRLA